MITDCLTLGDVCETRGRVGWKGYSVDDLRKEGPLVVGANDITSDNHLDLSNAKHLSREKYEESPEIFIYKNDILVVKIGSTIGKIAFVADDIGEATINPNCMIVRPIKVDPFLMYLYLCTKPAQDFILRYSQKSGQAALGQEDISKMPLLFDISRTDGLDVLKSIDKKIENNNAICSNLEGMSKLLYDYWFVQFDFPDENGKPYKSSGGKMIWNKELKREIPEGWEVGTISNLGDVVGGATPSTENKSYYTDNGIAWATPKDLSDSDKLFFTHGERDVTKEGLASCSAVLLPKGTVLMTSRAPIGYLAIAANEVCTNQGFKSIVPKSVVGTYYVYFTLLTMMPYIKRYGVGSTFAEVSKQDVESIKVIIPNNNVVSCFNNQVGSFFKEIEGLEFENVQLMSLRDFLLPMLMNGQVKVGKAGA